jgi:hypothetical protein
MVGQAWLCTPIVKALGRRRQEDHELRVRLGYIAKLSQKANTTKQKKTKNQNQK